MFFSTKISVYDRFHEGTKLVRGRISVFIFSAIEFSLGLCNAIFPCFDYFRVSPCRILTVNTQTRVIGFDICNVARQLYSVVELV